MNVAIVDDLFEERERLARILTDYSAQNKLDLKIHVFSCAEDMLASFRPYAYTAVFMDIYMDEMTGVEAAEQILKADNHTLLIFLTTSTEHMSKAFSLHVFDYIEKPATVERIYKVMDDILMRHTELSNEPHLIFSFNKKDISIAFSDICVIRASGHNTEITDVSRTTYSPRTSYSTICKSLNKDNRFIEVLRGVMVNMDRINSINGQNCTVQGGMILPINVRNAKKLKDIWQNYKLDSLRREQKQRRTANDRDNS